MNEKTLRMLEYHKVIDRVVEHTSFNASAELAKVVRPSTDRYTVRRLLSETNEARRLLELQPNVTIGGSRDIRSSVNNAGRGGVLSSQEMLDIKNTLISARNLARQMSKDESEFPFLTEIALRLFVPAGIVSSISKVLSDRGEIVDSASDKLGRIRSELRITHDRLLTKMQKMLTSKAIGPYLQDSLVTQRDGRYVLPFKTEAKGRIKIVIHDVSSSGATVFAEPIQSVELNNKWRELQINEKDEELRIMADLSDLIGSHQHELAALVEALAEIDLVFAKAKYSEKIDATAPVIKPFKPQKKNRNPGMSLKLIQARHPLIDPKEIVPIDIILNPETFVMVITGPNTGGKTVSLKTAGLLVLMAQSGLEIPAEAGSEMSLFSKVFADIGDEQSIEQSLSTFSGHITNIIKILTEANQRSLVIFDELGAGTDPLEGAALAHAILSYLVDNGISTLVATHYPELKAYAHSTLGVTNASLEFDLETLSPTYRLNVGLPGRSNALAIARRLGLQEQIVERARGVIDPTDLKVEDLLSEINLQRAQAEEARVQAELDSDEASMLRAELERRLDKIEEERVEIRNAARRQAKKEIDSLKSEIKSARVQIENYKKSTEEVELIENIVEELTEKIADPIEEVKIKRPARRILTREICEGDLVRLRILGQQGRVSAISNDQAEVQMGNLRVRVELDELDLIKEQKEDIPEPLLEDAAPSGSFTVDSPGVELSLRGLSVDEALMKLDHYIDRAYLSGLPYARIVHGKGTGTLREMVQRELKKNKNVSRFELGGHTEGGDGVTIAFFNR